MMLKLLVSLLLLLMVIDLIEASVFRNKRPYEYDVDDNEQLLDCYIVIRLFKSIYRT